MLIFLLLLLPIQSNKEHLRGSTRNLYRFMMSSMEKPSDRFFGGLSPSTNSDLASIKLGRSNKCLCCDRSSTGFVWPGKRPACDADRLACAAAEWLCMCVFRLARWLKLRLQIGHLCGASSKWVTLCTARVRDWQKPLPQSEHLNGFSFEWMYRWSRKWSCRRKAFPQMSHE